MTEHNWPGDDHDGHHDDGPHHDDGHDGGGHDGYAGPQHGVGPYPAEPDPHDVDGPSWAHEPSWGPDPHDADAPWPHTASPGDEPAAHDDPDPAPDTGGYAMGHVGADPDALPHVHEVPDVFAPPVDVGALPEPVDGFPWIDPAALGAAAPDTPGGEAPGDGAGLAAYAALEPGPDGDVDWARLAASDDPAVAALARFWRPTG